MVILVDESILNLVTNHYGKFCLKIIEIYSQVHENIGLFIVKG